MNEIDLYKMDDSEMEREEPRTPRYNEGWV